MLGRGTGLRWENQREVLTIADQAVIRVDPSPDGEGGGDTGAMDVSAGTANFARRDHLLRFEGNVTIIRNRQKIAATVRTCGQAHTEAWAANTLPEFSDLVRQLAAPAAFATALAY